MKDTEKKQPRGAELFYWLQTLTIPLVCIVLLFTFVGRVTRVVGSSMDPSLAEGELLLIWSLGYQPEAGDVVVVTEPTAEILGGEAIVKRVIATEGQVVQIDYDQNTVSVDGVVLDEPYILEEMDQIYHDTDSTVTYEVEEDSIFVMGDNRNNSTDSRNSQVGSVHVDYILGGAKVILFPFSKMGLL